MSAEENRLLVKIDADLSELDKKIDSMQERLEGLKREAESIGSSISSQISALNSYAGQAGRKDWPMPSNSETGSGGEAEKILNDVENKMRRQAVMISK